MVEDRHYEYVYEVHKIKKMEGQVCEIPRSRKMEDDRVSKVNTSRKMEDDISSDDGYYGSSPPPPYTKEDLLDYKSSQEEDGKTERRSSCFSSIEVNPRIEYNDVGEEINVAIPVIPNQVIGLTILSAKSLTPNWPVILDIKRDSPAWKANPELQIGDQIKEIHGIPTKNLKYSDIMNLFSKATDRLHLVLRRGVEPTKRQFDWFKFPFLSVSKDIEVITIRYTSNLQKLYECDVEQEPRFHTFVKEQQLRNDDLKRFKETEVSISNDGRFQHFRSLSASAPNRNMFLSRQRQRRKTVQESSSATASESFTQLKSRRPSGSYFKNTGSRSIINEVEMRRLRSDSRASSGIVGDMSRKSSQSSLSSSSTTISSFASSTNIEQQVENDSFIGPSKNIEQNNDLAIKTPCNKLRDSFRKKMKYKNNSAIMEQPVENTLNVTVWIPDRRKLGIKLGGGSVSPYGDSNICIMEIKKTGTAHKILRTGDEVLEVDGKLTSGMDVYQVNNILKSLEGNYVEMKIFRPFKI